MANKFEWPSREQWARDTVAYYYTGLPDPDYRIASHANEAEIGELIAALKSARIKVLRTWSKDARAKARQVNRVLDTTRKCIEAGDIPSPGIRASLSNSPLLDTIVNRMLGAHQAAIAAMPPAAWPPIGDAEWELELERRRYLEERIPLDTLA